MTPGPLVDVDWVAGHLGDPDLRLADCRWYLGEPSRGKTEYASGHLPGAVYVSLEEHLSASVGPGRHPLPSPAEFGAALGRLGIGRHHFVVAYDDRGGAIAARLWWMLRAVGHDRAAVLDGGLPAWTAAGRELTTEPTHLPMESFDVDAVWSPTIDRNQLEASLGDLALLDARDPERFRGESEPIDPVAGHIPTAVNTPYTGQLGSDGRFLDAATLRKRYEEAGVSDSRPTVVYCGSGVTACHLLLGMEVAGLTRAALYPGSWSDWSTSGGEVAVGG